MTDSAAWKRETSVRHLERSIGGLGRDPIPREYEAAAKYVDATVEQVKTWWKGRKK